MAETLDPRCARPAPHPSPVLPRARGTRAAGGLTVLRFEVIPVAGDLAILRLLLELAQSTTPPEGAALEAVAASAGRSGHFPAQAPRLERRVTTGARGGTGELLWRAAFGLPLELAAADDAEFSLTDGRGTVVALPSPHRRLSTHGIPSLTLTGPRGADRRRTAVTRQRLAALATAAVVTATSSPAVAVADGLAAGSPATPTAPSPAAPDAAAPAEAGAPTPAAATPVTSPAAPAPATPAATAPAGPVTDPAASAPAGTPAGATTATTPTAPATASSASEAPGTTTATATAGSAPATTTSTPSAAPATTAAGSPATPAAPAGATGPGTPTTTTPGAPAPSAAPGRHTGIRRARPASAAAVIGELVTAGALDASPRRPRRRPVVKLFATRGEVARRAAARSARRSCHTAAPSVAIAYAAAGLPTPGARLTVGPHACATGARAAARPGATGERTAPVGALLEILPNQPAPRRSAGAPRPDRAGLHRRLTAGRPHPRPRPQRPSAPSAAGEVHPLGTDPAVPGPGATDGTSTVSGLSSTAPGFLVPSAWTGTVTPDPSLTGAVTDLSGLLANGDRPPSFLVPIYMQAGRKYGIPWPVLAAINAIETDYGRNLNTSSAGAIGWMQFEPSTWKRYGVAVDGHSVPNPYDPRDAIFSAARYLAAAGAARDLAGAIFAYNHAGWYVSDVMTRATAIAHHVQYQRATIRRGTFTVDFATGVRRHPTVVYRGGVLSHFDRLIAAANMVSAAQFAYLWGGGHEQPARFGPFDCSGSVSYVLQQAGYRVPTSVSGNISGWKFPTGPGRVTIFFNPTHTFMRIGNRFFGTSLSRPGGGAGWIDVNRLPAGYLDQFAEVHVPHLGVNSFAPARRTHSDR